MFYERNMTYEMALRVLRIRMWDKGHSFEEIDSMNLQDFGDVVGYWSETDRAKAKMQKQFKKK